MTYTVTKFFKSDCAPCKAIGALLDWEHKINKEAFSYISVNIEDNPELAIKNKILSVPTIIITDSLGLEVDRIVGNAGLAKLREKLGKFIKLAGSDFNDSLDGTTLGG